VICRRDERAPQPDGGRVVLVALGVLVAAVAGAIVVKRRPFDSAVAAGAATAAATAGAVAADEDEPPNPGTRAPDFPSRSGRVSEAPRPAPRPDPRAASGAATAPSVAPTDDGARERAAELASAIQRVPIRMFSTAWCPVCRKAKAYLLEQRISFVEIDVERSPDAKRAHRALNPSGSVPTFDIDGEVLVGFGAEHLQAARRRAAERRLGR
jgi:glutaredoxin